MKTAPMRLLALILTAALLAGCAPAAPAPESTPAPDSQPAAETPVEQTPEEAPEETPQEEPQPFKLLEFARSAVQNIQPVDGVEAYSDRWFGDAQNVSADLSQSPALAYSLNIADTTRFAALPQGYDQEALIEWGKYPGLNVDILHKYGFTGKGAVVAYVDQPAAAHEQYADLELHYTNNTGNASSMHGPAVLSLLAGRDIGTAPEAEVYFYGHASGESDQTTHAECLYQIIEQNKSLPEGEKITMVGFSDNIDASEANADAFREAVAACEEAGVMVWFCGEYGSAAFLPMSDKNNFASLMPDQWTGTPRAGEVYVPTAGRTTAATAAGAEYIYWASGGLSWAMPYVLGLYAIALEIDPNFTQQELRTLLRETARTANGMQIVDPLAFVCGALRRVGRDAEADAMQAEAAARTRYLYAVMNTALMTEEDITAATTYLAKITEATVVTVDCSSFADAPALYTAIREDAAARGGTVAGVQLFGTANMAPAFRVQYKVQMIGGPDDGGFFLTDLFYGNLNNDPALLGSDYNVMDHFAQGWEVDLEPDWPVARLPLSPGEFTAFFEKYDAFVVSTGLVQQELVNFSNPISATSDPIDNMSAFLQRADKEFGILDVPYRLYANQDGDYPVTRPAVLGNFLAENIAAENERGIAEFVINTHGQPTNLDRCIFVNGLEQRISLMNTENINSYLDDNPYYLDCWTCLNGAGMADNLTTTALAGQCVGMFSATAIISNNGVNWSASLEKMQQSNFYYFYYSYLKALSEGASRSSAFFAAQQAYAAALLADSALPLRGEGNYQFNLCNLLAYHNFGVIEPSRAPIRAVAGKLAQSDQSLLAKSAFYEGTVETVTGEGRPVGEIVEVDWTVRNLEQRAFAVESFIRQPLDNGGQRFTLYYGTEGQAKLSAIGLTAEKKYELLVAETVKNSQVLVFDVAPEAFAVHEKLIIAVDYPDGGCVYLYVSYENLQ